MRKKDILFFYRFLAVMCCICLTACSDEVEEGAEGKNAPASFSLQVTSEGSFRTKTFGEDRNARENEFIHTLWIFITDANGLIEKKIVPDLSASTAAQVGNYLQYISDEFRLDKGPKKVYAFANMDAVYPVDEKTKTVAVLLDALTEGGTINSLLTLVVDDPARSLDFEKKQFIPMSVVKEINLQNQHQTEWVELVRLVSRVEMTVSNGMDEEIIVSGLSMRAFSDRVPLFAGGATLVEETCRKNSSNITLTSSTILPDGNSSASFYVNATEWTTSKSPFTVDLKIGNTNFTGQTARTDVPRNSIYPLSLNYADYQLMLDVEAEVAPIGGLPWVVQTTYAGNYVLELPEGCTFKITPSIKKKENEGWTYNGSWNWTLEESAKPIMSIKEATTETKVLEGNLTALAGQEGQITLKTGVKEFSITIKSVALQDLDEMVKTRSFFMPEQSLYELVNLQANQ